MPNTPPQEYYPGMPLQEQRRLGLWHGLDARQFFKPKSNHGCYRAPFHDYKRPGNYMITIRKGAQIEDFSRLIGNLRVQLQPDTPLHYCSARLDAWLAGTQCGDSCQLVSSPAGVQRGGQEDYSGIAPSVLLSRSGAVVQEQIAQIAVLNPDMDVPYYVIMPDHLHLIWRVKGVLKRDLGYYIGLFKSRCTKRWRELNGIAAPDTEGKPHRSGADALFAERFNDCIAFDEPTYLKYVNYVQDNPRRRLMAILMPEYFRRCIQVAVSDQLFDVYGNFTLLKHPMISPVVISSRHTPELKAKLQHEWDEIIRSGGVLVSAFISPQEREVMRRGIEGCASIIRLVPDGLYPKYKPHGREFDLCAEGRLLHVGKVKLSAARHTVTRAQALEYNDLAFWIASRTPGATFAIKSNPR